MSKNTTPTNPEISYTASFDGLVDIVNLDGSSAFLVREASGLAICPRYDFNGEAILPPPATPWLLADAREVEKIFHSVTDEKIADAALYDDLKEYHKSISELPSEVHYDLLAAWDLHTYVLESVQFSPVMCFYAEAERGKTRTGKGMIYAAYRGIYTSSLRGAQKCFCDTP